MSTTLALDFGNTRLKAALFQQDELKEVISLQAHDITGHLQQIIQQHRPVYSILSSVINHDAAIEHLLQQHTQFHKLDAQSKLNFTIPVGKPETVGADRLAIAAAAVHFYPGRHNLIIALGSCITYNFIHADAQLLGGAISPGIHMRFRSMNEYTALLPMTEAHWNIPLIGYDTVTNLQSGVVLGVAGEIEGMVQRYEERYGNFNALLTGGATGLISPHLKKQIFADPDFIFKGLYAISVLNHA
mgnify:CR=1 FL=1